MKVYEKSFKEEAVKLATEIETNKAADQLGVAKSTLSTWRSNKEKHREAAFVGSGNERIIPQNATEIRLVKKIKEFEKSNDILKAALGFFAKSQKK